MNTITTTLMLAQNFLSYPSSAALFLLMLYAWRRLRLIGFLVIAVGSGISIAARIFQSFIPPFRMGRMPFSGAPTLEDASRFLAFTLLHTCYIGAELLMVLGAIMAIRKMSNISSKRTREKPCAA